MLAVAANRKGGDVLSPSFAIGTVLLLLFVEFDGVAGVYIFQREDNHGGRCGRGDVQNYNFSDGAPRQIAHVNICPFASRHPIAFIRRRMELRVFRCPRVKR